MVPALETLHSQYQDQGLRVLGFYSNDFNQGGSPEECTGTYKITFDQFIMDHVKYGMWDHDADASTPNVPYSPRPVFDWLLNVAAAPVPGYNFNKYLVARDGSYVAHWGLGVNPTADDPEKPDDIPSMVEAELSKPKPDF